MAGMNVIPRRNEKGISKEWAENARPGALNRTLFDAFGAEQSWVCKGRGNQVGDGCQRIGVSGREGDG